MTTTEQLRQRAFMMLRDGKKHRSAAFDWAYKTTGLRERTPEMPDTRRMPFSLRELSLGAK